ncbi:MAG: amidohydrolase family protein [Anaerolineaceae bacterium]
MDSNLVIENATIVTMNPKREILHNASIAISNDRIEALGKVDAIRSQYPSAKFVDGSGKVVLPGLINCHTHISMSLQKGITLAVPEGLYRVMWPVEKTLTPEDVYIGALIGGAEALLGGTTCIIDHYYHIEQVAKAIIKLGLRGFLGHTIMSRLGPITGESEFREGIDFVSRWKNHHPLVHPMLAPHASDTVSLEWLKELRQIATKQDVRIHMHLAQSTRERAYIWELYGMGCVDFLDDLGFLSSDVLVAHCIYIDETELDKLAASGAHPVYCPMGHSQNGHPMHAWELMQRGAGVLIGTDSVCNNNVMDLVGELRIAGAAQRQLTGDSKAMPSIKILEAVTVDAAEAIGMSGQLGALVPGYLADLIVLNMAGLHSVPNYSVLDNIIYTCTGRDVEIVIVNGEVVVQDGKLCTANEAELIEMAEIKGHELIRRAVHNDPELSWLWK